VPPAQLTTAGRHGLKAIAPIDELAVSGDVRRQVRKLLAGHQREESRDAVDRPILTPGSFRSRLSGHSHAAY
jgi:hypothetical protein